MWVVGELSRGWPMLAQAALQRCGAGAAEVCIDLSTPGIVEEGDGQAA